ncbi:hypothetical protein [Occultella gossypii]|uniref:Uncharacterized protein n=1 Tax=Occultella gossypii TaxID=2800820 RepID=A0ABS7S4R3_9MICO|nr:hypothetical protein [Occultella gossypii]MBZ2194589.1 hypothetical protein [Occultella gossypii]
MSMILAARRASWAGLAALTGVMLLTATYGVDRTDRADWVSTSTVTSATEPAGAVVVGLNHPDGGIGYRAELRPGPGRLVLVDNADDGAPVLAYIWIEGEGPQVFLGAGPGTQTQDLDVPPDREIGLQVCVQGGACSATVYGRS